MVQIRSIEISPPLLNTSCAWASEYSQLRELYDCPHIGAITTRTATLNGFKEDSSNTVVFATDTVSSLNSYGYSPNPLASYIKWVYTLLTTPLESGVLPTKPVIISITASTPDGLLEMLSPLQELRARLKMFHEENTASTTDPSMLIALELNTSCPNIKNHPPPAYNFHSLRPLLDVFAAAFRADPTLTIGLKLPPYLYSTLFSDVVSSLASYSSRSDVSGNPFAFLTCTNTLGSSLLFAEQVVFPTPSVTGEPALFALPTPYGGLAGEAIHALALGNVHTFSQLLAAHPDPAVKQIAIIGAGGVTNPQAVARMRAAGAKVVGSATLLGKEGVKAFELLSQSA